MADRPKIIVSTDSVGALGNPNDVLSFWRRAAPESLYPDIGLEVVAWRYNWSRFSPDLKSRIVGFHGRTHTLREKAGLGLHLANIVITPPEALISQSRRFPQSVYVLNHTPIIRHLSAVRDLHYLALNNLNQTLVIENDVYPGALTESLRLASNFGPRNLVCDLYHLYRELGSWDAVASRFAVVAPFCFTFHFPIGTKANDSIPLDIPDSFLASVSQTLVRHQLVPVLECQWGGLASVICRPQNSPARISHVKHWLNRLHHIGFLS